MAKKTTVVADQVEKVAEQEFVGDTKQIAKKMRLKGPTAYLTVNLLLKVLLRHKKARVVGKKPNASGKGKPITVYAIPQGEFTVALVA